MFSLHRRLSTTGPDRLALVLIGLAFGLLFLGGLVDDEKPGPLRFISLFLDPILDPKRPMLGLADALFVAALLLAGYGSITRASRAWRSDAIVVGGSVPLGPSWRERASRAASVLGERRGSNGMAEPGSVTGPTTTARSSDGTVRLLTDGEASEWGQRDPSDES